MPTLAVGTVKTIIESDASFSRFESYCNAVVSRIEGELPVVSTSASWDLGRDGRGLRGSKLFVCASLDPNVPEKALRDIRRLLSRYANPTRIYFCSSADMSEHAIEGLKTGLIDAFGDGIDWEVLGSRNLAESDVALAVGAKTLHLAHWYRAELADATRLLGFRDDSALEENALRLALMAMGPDDSLQIRHGVLRSLILDVLVARLDARVPVAELLSGIADNLKLAKPPPWEPMVPVLDDLVATGLVRSESGVIVMTPDGRAAAEADRDRAVRNALEGRAAVRQQLEDSM